MDPIQHHRSRMHHHLRMAEHYRAMGMAHRHDRGTSRAMAEREHFHRARALHHRRMMESFRRHHSMY